MAPLRLFLPALLAVLIHTAVLADTRPREFRSIPPLTVLLDNGAHRTICTAFSIDEQRRYWMTAAHCLPQIVPVYIEGEAVEVVIDNRDIDVAVVATKRARARSIRLARTAPGYGEAVTIPGYPLGVRMLLTGTVASPDAQFPFGPPPTRRALFHLAGAKGGSGAPVLNRRGELVSIFQTTGETAFDNGLVGGIVWSLLRPFSRFFEGGEQETGQPVLDLSQIVLFPQQ